MFQLVIPNFHMAPVRRNIIEWQLTLLSSISRSYIYREHLYELIERTFEITPKNAMVHAHNSVFNDFISKWPMLFGNNSRSNRSHWEKALIKNPVFNNGFITSEAYRKAVLNYLQGTVGIDNKTYNLARTAVRTARDRYTSHLDIGRIPAMPDLRYPYEIAKAYSNLLSNIVEEEDFRLPPTLAEREEFYQEEAELLFPGH